MNVKQKRAAERLRKALDACYVAGLKGGVFDCSFLVWPEDAKPEPRETGRFFEAVDEVGLYVKTKMNLDGGAGV